MVARICLVSVVQERERLEAEKKLNEKIAARSHARSYVSDVLASTFATLQTEGFFYDPLTREINEIFVRPLPSGHSRFGESPQAFSPLHCAWLGRCRGYWRG